MRQCPCCAGTQSLLSRAHTRACTHILSNILALPRSLSLTCGLCTCTYVGMLCVCSVCLVARVCMCALFVEFYSCSSHNWNGIINVNFNRFITLLGKSYNRLLTSATWRFQLIGFRSLRNSIDIEDLRIKN